jgi:hypothetical protein
MVTIAAFCLFFLAVPFVIIILLRMMQIVHGPAGNGDLYDLQQYKEMTRRGIRELILSLFVLIVIFVIIIKLLE